MLYFYLKIQQNAIGGRALPWPVGGAYSTPTDPLAGLKGEGSEGEGTGRERKGEEGKEKDPPNVSEVRWRICIKELINSIWYWFVGWYIMSRIYQVSFSV